MKRSIQNFLIVAYLLSLIILGIRGYIAEDTRFGWGMFRNQIDYQIEYSWELESGERIPHDTGKELKRGGPHKVSSDRTHRTRYGIGAVRSWINLYLRYIWEDRRLKGSESLTATIGYKVNRSGDRIVETFQYPPRGKNP